MNKTLLALAVIASLGLSACSTTKTPESSGTTMAADTKTPVKDLKISTEFKDDGIRITYSMMGDLEKITVFGTAPAWKGNHTVLAELDAMDKLVKFVYGQDVSSERRQKIIAESIDRASDATKIRILTDEAVFDSRDLERTAANDDQDNVSKRNATRLEKTMVTTVQTITSGGRLTGVRKTGDRVTSDGRVYIAVYEWNERDQAVSVKLRNLMNK